MHLRRKHMICPYFFPLLWEVGEVKVQVRVIMRFMYTYTCVCSFFCEKLSMYTTMHTMYYVARWSATTENKNCVWKYTLSCWFSWDASAVYSAENDAFCEEDVHLLAAKSRKMHYAHHASMMQAEEKVSNTIGRFLAWL